MMNPNQILNMFIQNNPQIQNNPMIQNALSMAQKGNAQGLQALAQNLAKEKGVDINALKRQIETNLQVKL